MCTAIHTVTRAKLFGRTLDLETSYGESVVITPRAFPFSFLRQDPMTRHAAMIGTAHLFEGQPLYYDAVNEYGLAIAALRFADCAVYRHPLSGMRNVASFELIPWILGQCTDVEEALVLLRQTNLLSDSVHPSLPATPLHWLIADRGRAVTAEPLAEGLRLTDNPLGILTNSPDFFHHTAYLAVSEALPGGYGSVARFCRAAYAEEHTLHEGGPTEEISRFFHVADTVFQPCGYRRTETGEPIRTQYVSCADLSTGTYYFTTYRCRRIRSLSLREHPLDGKRLLTVPMAGDEDVLALKATPHA